MKYKDNTIRIDVVFILGIVFLFGILGYKLWLISTHNVVEGSDLAAIAKNRTTVTKRFQQHVEIYMMHKEIHLLKMLIHI